MQEGKNADKAFQYLYKTYFRSVKKMVVANSGDEEEAHDIFQDALIVFYQAVRRGKFELKAKVGTYLFAVARNRWLAELSKRKVKLEFQAEAQSAEATPLRMLLDKEQKMLLSKAVAELNEDCQEILRLSIYEELPMKEISERMGHSNDQVSRNKKSRCLKYLTRIIKESPLLTLLKSSET